MLQRLGIERGERRLFAWGAAALFLLGWADVSVKNVSEVFFVKRVGVELMPLAFLASSALLVATTWLVGRLVARHDRLRLLPVVFVGLGMILLPLWILVRTGYESAFALLLIASKQITSIALLVFWIALTDLLHGRQTKRLFAPMMAGMTLGTILGSFASGPLGERLGIAGLLPTAAVALALAGALASQLRRTRSRFRQTRTAPSRPGREGRPAAPTDAVLSLWRSQALFRALLISTLCSGLLGPMLYFQFQYVADLATTGHGSEQKLLALYAQFRGWIYGVVLAIQVVGAGRLYRHVGLPLAAALSPLTYLVAFVGLSARLSLPVGVAAMAGTKIQDEAIYDPALRVLYGLLPDGIRPRATALIEGPIKRGGGAVGNAAIVLALALGSPAWVGYVALPIALAWLIVSLVLWRQYPQLLLGAVAARKGRREALQDELLDPATARALIPEICGGDDHRARLAAELVGDAAPCVAAGVLAEALLRAPPSGRTAIVAALDRCLERSTSEPFAAPEVALRLAEVLRAGALGLAPSERADIVRAYARLTPGAPALALLDLASDDPSAAVRLAALAAIEQRRAPRPEARSLDTTLADALRDDDSAVRRTARKELRSLLLCSNPDVRWRARLATLAAAFADNVDRDETGDALAEIAQRHRAQVAPDTLRMLEAREDPQPRVRAALLRWAGYAGQHDQLAWLVENLASEDEDCAAAAREGVSALGSTSSAALLRELSYGRRSKREAILEVMRGLDLPPEELRELYELELDTVERDLQSLLVLQNRPPLELLRQRLAERAHEALHTALLFLAAIHRKERIAALAERLREIRNQPRQRAIAIEALDALLPPSDRSRLLPLLDGADPESPTRSSATAPASDVERTLRYLVNDPEDLTRTIATGLLAAAERSMEEQDVMNVVETMSHLKKVSLFEDLTARELMELARAAKQTRLEAHAAVVREGQYDDCLYLVIEGVVHIRRGEILLTELGPGDFFGEIALLEGVPRSADAVTQTRVRLLALERCELMDRIDENPGIAVGMLRRLARRVRELTDRVAE